MNCYVNYSRCRIKTKAHFFFDISSPPFYRFAITPIVLLTV